MDSKINVLKQWITEFCVRRLDLAIMSDRKTIPPQIILGFARNKLFGLLVPETSGGLELDSAHFSEIIECLALIDVSLAVFVAGHNVALKLLIEQLPEQQEIIQDLACGRKLIGFSLTENNAGSNPRAITSSLNQDQNSWILNGSKNWAGSAGWADYLCLFAKVSHNEGSHIVGLLLDVMSPGVSIGDELDTLGLKATVQNKLLLTEVMIPDDMLFPMHADGLALAESAMQLARHIINVIALALQKKSFAIAFEHAKSHMISSGKMIANPVVKHNLSRMLMDTQCTKALVSLSLDALSHDAQEYEPVIMACKVISSELAGINIDRSLQLLGAQGYEESSVIARMYKDVRVLRIFEGPTDTLLMHIGIYLITENDSAYITRLFSRNAYESDLSQDLQTMLSAYQSRLNGMYDQDSSTAHLLQLYFLMGTLFMPFICCIALNRHGAFKSHKEKKIALEQAHNHYEMEKIKLDYMIKEFGHFEAMGFDELVSEISTDLVIPTQDPEANTAETNSSDTKPGFGLSIEATKDAQKIDLKFSYQKNVFTQQQIEQISLNYQSILKAIVSDTPHNLDSLDKSLHERKEDL